MTFTKLFSIVDGIKAENPGADIQTDMDTYSDAVKIFNSKGSVIFLKSCVCDYDTMRGGMIKGVKSTIKSRLL